MTLAVYSGKFGGVGVLVMRTFCDNCRDDVAYSVEKRRGEMTIKGKMVSFEEKLTFCKECKQELLVNEIMDENLTQLDRAYRIEEGLIQREEIESLLAKYDIGKRPLSQLLGWGDLTVSRFLDGNIPSRQYSDTLKRLLIDSNFMRELLEEGKDRISQAAHLKVEEALKRGDLFNLVSVDSMIDRVIRYILAESGETTPLALQKQLYYTQGFYMAFYEEELFVEDCEAWKHGPVYRKVYHRYKKYGYNPIEDAEMRMGDINLTNEVKEVVDNVISSFACYSGKILEKMTHAEEPWRKSRSSLTDGEGSEMIITKEFIRDYFTKIKEKYQMLNISDMRDYSQDMFKKIQY